ncbi:MAG: RusA family crossover junction endodeoxyribonuclease [Microcoleaceae cyanobacterium]
MQKLKFYLDGAVTPKARPRVSANGTYLPKRYKNWREQAECDLLIQVREMKPAPKLPLEKAAITLLFTGKHRTNSDLDNLAGACLDALTLNGAGILTDDNIKCVPRLTVEYEPKGKTGVEIVIEPLP